MLSVNVRKNSVWFVDMDGTIAEWRPGTDSQLRLPGYYRNLRPTGFLPSLKAFAAEYGRVYILSSYLTGCQALQDKQEWMDEHFPEIDRKQRLFVPYGACKADFVKEQFGLDVLTEEMVLFDDFSKNLHEWQAAGGKGVKCYNGINGNHGTWSGDGVTWSNDLKKALEMSVA